MHYSYLSPEFCCHLKKGLPMFSNVLMLYTRWWTLVYFNWSSSVMSLFLCPGLGLPASAMMHKIYTLETLWSDCFCWINRGQLLPADLMGIRVCLLATLQRGIFVLDVLLCFSLWIIVQTKFFFDLEWSGYSSVSVPTIFCVFFVVLNNPPNLNVIIELPDVVQSRWQNVDTIFCFLRLCNIVL